MDKTDSTKQKRIQIWLTEDEHARVKAMAALQRLALQDYVKQVTLDALDRAEQEASRG